MTAKTSEALAKVLDEIGLVEMARKARLDTYHDYLSDLAMPEITLEAELRWNRDNAIDPILAKSIEAVRQRFLNGDFDASAEESDEWAQSPEGQETFRMFTGEKKK